MEAVEQAKVNGAGVMDQLELIPERQFAKEIGRCQRVIQNLRRAGTGPAYIILGREVFYRRDAIRAWLLAREQKPGRGRRG